MIEEGDSTTLTHPEDLEYADGGKSLVEFKGA